MRPLTDWGPYLDRTMGRITALLAKAGMDDEQQAKFIDDIINATEDEPDLPEEGAEEGRGGL